MSSHCDGILFFFIVSVFCRFVEAKVTTANYAKKQAKKKINFAISKTLCTFAARFANKAKHGNTLYVKQQTFK